MYENLFVLFKPCYASGVEWDTEQFLEWSLGEGKDIGNGGRGSG